MTVAGTLALELRAVRHAYGGRIALDDLSLQVQPGEIYGLLGPNGAGKTTAISIACGLVDPTAGTVLVDGRAVHGDVGVRAGIGLVPQEVALWGSLTARRNLRFFGRLYGLRRARLADAVDAALALVGLVDRADERVDTYSTGMKRRLNIAAGLLHGPALLLLDEPTVGVDPQSRLAILEGVEKLAATGTAVVLASHLLGEVELVCRRVGILDGGRLVAEGAVDEIIHAAGVGEHVVIRVAGDGGALGVVLGAMDAVADLVVVRDELEFTCQHRDVVPRALAAAVALDLEIVELRRTGPDLERAFLALTGRALRE